MCVSVWMETGAHACIMGVLWVDMQVNVSINELYELYLFEVAI